MWWQLAFIGLGGVAIGGWLMWHFRTAAANRDQRRTPKQRIGEVLGAWFMGMLAAFAILAIFMAFAQPILEPW